MPRCRCRNARPAGCCCCDGDSGIWRDHRFGELPSAAAPRRPAGIQRYARDTGAAARHASPPAAASRCSSSAHCRRAGARAAAGQQVGAAGMRLPDAGGTVRILARQASCGRSNYRPRPCFFRAHGRVPLPPYIRRPVEDADRQRYQSVWARVPGAVAAPTASLHFDCALLEALAAHGIERAWLTLHVGAGTFAPVSSEDLRAALTAQRGFEIGAATVAAIGRAHADGGRVIAVGTTVARALESAAQGAASSAASQPTAGETTLFIRPGFRFRVDRWPADQFPPAAVDAADAGSRVRGTRARTCGLRACGARRLPLLQLRRRHAGLAAAAAGLRGGR